MQKALALLLSAVMLLCLHPAAAQQPNTLTGTVTDSASGKAVGYATVSLQRDSATVVNAVAARYRRPLLAQSPRNGRLPALHHDGRLHALQTGRGSARIGQGARQDRHHAGCRGRRRGDRSPETARNGPTPRRPPTRSRTTRRLRRARSTKSSARFRNSRSTATATSCSTDRAITRYCSTGAIRQR